MGSKRPTDVSTAFVLDNPVDVTLNFSEMESFTTRSQEIRRSLLTGLHTKRHHLRPANIVLSTIRDFESDAGLFEYVDFKDSFAERSVFRGCSFDFAAIINCDFEAVEFENCHFHNVSITGTTFRNVLFKNCALDHMVIELCKFFDCKFLDCTTSNKLFDFCLFSNPIIHNTNLQIQTLIGNFGIYKEAITASAIRDRSIDEEFCLLGAQDIASYPVSTPIEAFKVSHFLDRDATLAGSNVFEATFALDSWIGTAKIPLTFTNILTLYMEFLLDLYESGKIIVFPILKLHSLTGALVEHASIPTAAMTPIYGVHMTLARIAEAYLAAVTSTTKRLGSIASILVNGPLDPGHYLANYPYIFARPGIAIVSIKKHNSPNEMFLAWDTIADMIPFVALFMASRFKIEVASYGGTSSQMVESQSGSNLELGKSLLPGKSLFAVNLGFDQDSSHLYGLKIKSIFPGNLLVELSLQLSIRQVTASRLLLLKILNGGERKE
ncbi:pentapeptide repeat-containing protein [Azospirillum oryzae]|nr:pentapeptide repeat-containing protein [Azospirillum oryzae]